jgi:hypothetical protein
VARLNERIPVSLPGLVVYGTLWLLVLIQFDFPTAASNSMDTLWQSLGLEYLSADPLGSLSVLHIQPWGLNALYAFDLAVTPSLHVVLLVVYFLAGAATIFLLAATLLRVGLPRVWAMVAGLILALLPGTVLYAFWPYNVTLSGFLGIVTAYGLSLMRTQPAIGSGVSALGALGLQLTRATFVWVFVAAWCLFLFVLLFRRFRGKALAIAAIPVFTVAAISLMSQAYYWANFSLPAMSSWSGQNVAKALLTSGKLNVTDSAREQIAQDPCLASLLSAYETQALNVWDPGGLLQLPGCEQIGVADAKDIPAWDQDYRSSGQLNYNSRVALTASREWTQMMTVIIRNDPLQLVRMAVSTNTGPRGSGVGIYLDPSDEFPWVDAQRSVLPLGSVTGLLSLVFAPALVVLILLGIGQSIFVRNSYLRNSIVFWAALGVVAFHAAASTLAEYAENMRFRAEIDPLLLLLGVMSLYAISRGSRGSTETTKDSISVT